jgi:hypothetical protein
MDEHAKISPALHFNGGRHFGFRGEHRVSLGPNVATNNFSNEFKKK